MLTEAMVQREIDTGLSAVCAWCLHYWEARGRAKGTPFACGAGGCGGPSQGRAFPRYNGPRPNKASYCFICGRDADMAVEFHAPDAGGMVGCCAAHERMLKMVLANRRAQLVVKERLVPVIGAASDPDAGVS
jgi:hypothetical protein